ncbi:hypothetical protein DY000_02025276 [Brassica cretica]|uniref:Terpene synthase metal-binding domain-containing protein n=1 Tax=Brassica cretica TaxID=69181 RepID=A0ABQ7E7K4_BRACR|nr:hypothetical protein DY000_02025276 [Brassica cretica]
MSRELWSSLAVRIAEIHEVQSKTILSRETAIHALEMPYHWRMRRLETRWYIDAYEKKHDMNLALMELAKIDFNIIQASYQEELKYATRCSAIVLRLANDLATSPDELARGDVLKSVQCYMHETGASEKEARAHMQQMISDTWNEMNYETKIALVPRG